MNVSPQKSVITLGSGQLGLMLGKAAKSLNIPFEAFSLEEAWRWLEHSDATNCVISFEQEHVDEALLAEIQKRHIPCFPGLESFTLLRSKLSQKQFLAKHKIPSSPFLAIQSAQDAKAFLQKHKGAVLKAGRGGYDGKGVWILDSAGSTSSGENLAELLPQIREAYLEEKIAYDYEIAAVVCRSTKGEIALYPTVKSLQKNGICAEVEYTKEFAASKIAKAAGTIAQQIAEKLSYVGVLAVELFVVGDKILVNEIAPRVHNSGHFTIDVCAGSQFENHLRAGLGLPLADSKPSSDTALMVNLLWPPSEKEFAPLYTRLTCGPEWPANAKLHWYGKSGVRAWRKMGHFTVYSSSLEECKKIAQQILASRWAVY